MRISELSRQSGVPVATIKFYLREGLLPDGERTSAHPGPVRREHVARLRLIRALLGPGGLTVAKARDGARPPSSTHQRRCTTCSASPPPLLTAR